MVGDEETWMKMLSAAYKVARQAQEEVWEEMRKEVEEEQVLPRQVICSICGDNWAPYFLPESQKYFCSRAHLTEGRIQAHLLWPEYKPYYGKNPPAA